MLGTPDDNAPPFWREAGFNMRNVSQFCHWPYSRSSFVLSVPFAVKIVVAVVGNPVFVYHEARLRREVVKGFTGAKSA